MKCSSCYGVFYVIRSVKSRVLNHCPNFANHVEKQLKAQERPVAFLQVAQNEVQNYFKTRSEDVCEKLQKANQLVDSTSAEYHALDDTEALCHAYRPN